MPRPAVPPCAAGQFGVFSAVQAHAAGWMLRQVRRRLAAGGWKVVAGQALASAELSVGPWQLAEG